MYTHYYNRTFTPTGTSNKPVPFVSGTSGQAAWSFMSNGTLRTEGGEMADYTSSNSTSTPWYKYRSLISDAQLHSETV